MSLEHKGGKHSPSIMSRSSTSVLCLLPRLPRRDRMTNGQRRRLPRLQADPQTNITDRP